MRSSILKNGLICLGAGLLLESPAVTASAVYTVKAQENDSTVDTSNIKSILLIGQDKQGDQTRQRSDSMILATLDKDQGTISLTSFMRDLYVAIPGYSSTRINAAYAYGGMELLDETLEENFGVQIDGNVEVDFEVFKVLVDKVGGIDLELTQAEADYICGRDQSVLYPQPLRTDWDLQEGVNHLDGEQALIHARNRSIGNSDYRRTERQQDVLKAAFAKIKDLNVLEIGGLIKDVLPLVTTDLSLWDMTGYAMDVMSIGTDEIQSYRIPEDGSYTPQTIDGMQVLVPDLEQNREYLQQILYHAGE
ncbi:LCP family protein [Blautia sp. Sow4_E7]|uniref:LCP family protein n=1 Tax=Blautia sp. Sow4_E7 TaxID=3438749 RepID=UPI003F9191C6